MMDVPVIDYEIEFSAIGGELVLDIDWPVTTAAELTVVRTRNSVPATLGYPADWTLEGGGTARGAAVKLAVAALKGDIYNISSSPQVELPEGDAGVVYVLARWAGAWQVPFSYRRGDAVRSAGASYVARVPHLATVGTQPGVGPQWPSVWDLAVAAGEDGLAGPGVPAGGTVGLFLQKNSTSDYDTQWTNSVPLVGVNATPDTTNRLAVSSPGTLFNHQGAGHQAKINKNAAADTASILFQTTFSGRAEMGTTGDDDFHFKVSADGTTWREAIVINRTTGVVQLPLTPSRERLTANRTYFVRTDGSDANTGLVNTAGGSFLTIQKAIDVATALDLSIYGVTIQVADGTYTGAVTLKSYVGAGPIRIRGNTAAPANVHLNVPAGCIEGDGVLGAWRLGGLKLSSSAGILLLLQAGTVVGIDEPMEYGAAGSFHIIATTGARLSLSANYRISGGAAGHLYFLTGAFLVASGITVTVTGTPNFPSAFAVFSNLAGLSSSAWTFSGAATGPRYTVNLNAVINTAGGGANFFPGNAAGSAAFGGQYL